MEKKIFGSSTELAAEAAQKVQKTVLANPKALLCLAAGHSSIGLFNELINLNKEKKIDFSQTWFVGLDEWTGLGIRDMGSCINFMKENLFDHINIPAKQVVFFDGCASELETECRRIDDFLSSAGPVDLMVLGLGMNGHLGLNEPGVSFDLYSHITELDPVTRQVGQKYFTEPVDLKGGITLGIRHILESKEVLLMVSGKHKAGILQKAIEDEVNVMVPASVLQIHPNATIMMDSHAASMLQHKSD